MNLSAGKNRYADVETGLADTVGEEEGGMSWESSTDRYTPPCVQQTASGKPLDTQGARPGSATTQGVGGEGIYIQSWLIHAAAQQKPTQHWKELSTN